ncbi:multi-beta-barrel domain surface protein OmpL47 [Leptospira sp. GIMC2001]|uniref:multi-beta-barrel domain surface protein OmpL47 n=1 Tax=Leptospira sp. GIMC2001 TaxID=1513297 RepID=UPI00234AB21E|nr:hypothetical protein [Leptospira sp. GIMC2001]WCL50422.1 hypothetical protein O4O04_06270 [Leptospira sp. GIMC2001]
MAVSAYKKIIALALVFASVSLFSQANENLEDEVADPKATSSSESTEPKENTEPSLKKEATSTSTTRSATSTSTKESETIANNADLYINSRTAFELKASDDSSQVDYIEYRVNTGDFIKYSSPVTISTEGVSQITYRAVDRAGNIEPSRLLTVVVDNTPPSVLIMPVEPLHITQGANYASKSNTFTFKADDALSGVEKIEYSINESGFETFAADSPLKLEKSGSNLIRYTATDNSGNKSRESSIAVIIDEKAPTVEIIPNVPLVEIDGKTYSKKGNVFTIRAFDGESGIRRVLVKVDGDEEFRPYVDGIVVDAQGEHKIEAKAIDNVGNESELKAISFLVDVNPPQSEIKKISAEPAE